MFCHFFHQEMECFLLWLAWTNWRQWKWCSHSRAEVPRCLLASSRAPCDHLPGHLRMLPWDHHARKKPKMKDQVDRNTRLSQLYARGQQMSPYHLTACWERITSSFVSLRSGWYATQPLVTNLGICGAYFLQHSPSDGPPDLYQKPTRSGPGEDSS